ncbi:MAG: glycerate kinase [Propionicimonas sp.]|uniref:glycerate kinase n=1 Tax=Propionicimonas sp. TaxID=1955623 RepID=UPI003D0BF6BE
MSPLHVAVVTGRVGGLDPLAAGTALARGFAEARVAVVPVAAGGPDLAVAAAALWGVDAELGTDRWLVRGGGRVLLGLREPDVPDWAPEASTADLGAWVADSLRPDDAEVALDLTGVTAHDGGAGLLAAAGEALAGRRITGIVAADERDLPATGIGGGLARRAFGARLDIAQLLAADAVLAGRARQLGEGLEVAPGGGAAGGTGMAVLALGGLLVSGTQFCHHLAGLDRTLRAADLVVTGCTELSALDRGGPVVTAVAEWAEAAQRPCLLVTSGSGLARRELRTMGIEAAHLLPAGPVTADALTSVAARIAAGWYVGGGGLA